MVSVSDKFDAGQVFKEEDVLLTIDSRDYELALAQAEATVAQADLRLQMEEKEAAVVRREWQLLNQGKPSGLQAHARTTGAGPGCVSSRKSGKGGSPAHVERCQVRAPFDGMVAKALFGPGNLPRWPYRLARRFSQPTLPR